MPVIRYYVGVSSISRIVFRASSAPTDDETGAYRYVIGPFRTKGAALLMARYGAFNTAMRHVDDCERLNKQLPVKWYQNGDVEPNQYLNGMQPKVS